EGFWTRVDTRARLGNRKRGPHVEPFHHPRAEGFRNQMAPGVERHNAPRVCPLRKRTNFRGRMRIREVWTSNGIERSRRNRERPIYCIRAAVGTDDVTIVGPRDGADNRSASARSRRAPVDRESLLRARVRTGGPTDMVRWMGTSHCKLPGRKDAGPPFVTGLTEMGARSPII